MHCTVTVQPIATTKPSCDRIAIKTPQRKARYTDKTRVRLVDIKIIALRECKCRDTAEMRQRLQSLGIKLDLRLTSAWIAIVQELQNLITAAVIKVGSRVIWDYPIGWGYVETWFPLIVTKREGIFAYVDMMEKPVLLSTLTLAA